MSRLYEALRRLELGNSQSEVPIPEIAHPAETFNNVMDATFEIEGAHAAELHVSPESRLVALSDPKSLGAEKFRALATRLEHLREKTELRSLQVTSAVVNEGKSLVSANLAITLVKHFGFR